MEKLTGVCLKCGREKGTKEPECATMWIGECIFCGKKGTVTAERDFGIHEKMDMVDFFENLDKNRFDKKK